jgi:hypothetical protein
MKRIIALVAVGVLAIATIVPVFADQPPGQLGYEGQPGNQGGGGGDGLQGYEGQGGN